MTSSRVRRSLAATAALTLLALGVAGCSGSEEASSGSASADISRPEAAIGVQPSTERGAVTTDSSAADAAAAPAEEPADVDPTISQALIKQGTISLRSADVAQARFDVRKIVDVYGGEIAESNIEADREGEPERARLVLRIPVADFTAAMEDLEGTADLITTSSTEEDVTTQVIDTDVRTELQRRSIDRIQLLLDRARSIQAIVGIERELSRREADLGSLEQRQNFLADQTTMATITVSLERPAEKQPPSDNEKDDGFLAGLSGGWAALKSLTVGVLTVGGAVLPFALVLLVLGVPAYALRRRIGGRGVTADQAPASG